MSKRSDFFPAFSDIRDSNIVRTMYNYNINTIQSIGPSYMLLCVSPEYWIRLLCDAADQFCILFSGPCHLSVLGHLWAPHCSTNQRRPYVVLAICCMENEKYFIITCVDLHVKLCSTVKTILGYFCKKHISITKYRYLNISIFG